MRLRLGFRRWFCDAPACPRRIFTERFPGVVHRYARRTDRLATILRRLGLALGGEAGARLATELGLVVSPDTLLRQLKQAAPSSGPAPRVLGVVDFAFRRGHRYGTILVDLERGHPSGALWALLPDRRAETLAQRLREHPGVEIISRDRSAAYEEGARDGAPSAKQVADRWHLLKNLVEALETTVAQEVRAFSQAASTRSDGEALPEIEGEARVPPGADASTDTSTLPTQALFTPAEARRRQLYEEVQRLQRLGWSQRAISQELGQPLRTIQRYAHAPDLPARKRRIRPPGQLAPYGSYLEEGPEQGCRNVAQLWKKLQDQGFTGSCSAV